MCWKISMLLMRTEKLSWQNLTPFNGAMLSITQPQRDTHSRCVRRMQRWRQHLCPRRTFLSICLRLASEILSFRMTWLHSEFTTIVERMDITLPMTMANCYWRHPRTVWWKYRDMSNSCTRLQKKIILISTTAAAPMQNASDVSGATKILRRPLSQPPVVPIKCCSTLYPMATAMSKMAVESIWPCRW